MWVNTVTPNQTLLSQWESRVAGRFAWFIQGDGTVKMITNVAPFDATVQPSSLTAVTDGQWHHIACTYDYDTTTSTGVLKMYVDGILEDTTDPLGFSYISYWTHCTDRSRATSTTYRFCTFLPRSTRRDKNMGRCPYSSRNSN